MTASLKKILILAANPQDMPQSLFERQVREIQEGLRRAKCRDQFEIQHKVAVQLRDLRRSLLDFEPHIVHFCGCGVKDGLNVVDNNGNAIRVPTDALSGLFALFAKKIECVLLNACYSLPQAKAINQHIDYVVGMNRRIEEKAALEFAVGFYDALGAGKPVEEAFKFGCNAIQIYNIPGHLVPQLLKKETIYLPTGEGEKIEEAEPDRKSCTLLKKPPEELLPNPFTTTLAISDPARFIGRETEMRRLMTLLKDSSVALLGEPKIGKSSLLFELARKWNGKIIGPINFLDLEAPEDFYQQIAAVLKLNRHDWKIISHALKTNSMLLLIDELDCGPKIGLTQYELNRFRAVSEKNPGFKIVAVSRTPLKDVFPDPGWGSPLHNLLQPLTLGPLQRDDALLLLNHPWAPEALTFDTVTVDRLLYISACHPFKLQKAAYHCYEALGDSLYDWEAKFLNDVEHLL